jgi:hypothetical protein
VPHLPETSARVYGCLADVCTTERAACWITEASGAYGADQLAPKRVRVGCATAHAAGLPAPRAGRHESSEYSAWGHTHV